MKFELFCYRDWAIKCARETITLLPSIDISIKDKFSIPLEEDSSETILIFIGWSDIIPSHIIKTFPCFCIHPSALPQYRGGSPIQNQIIDGVINSKVTLFKMSEGIDEGDIYDSHPILLDGYLNDVMLKISTISSVLINNLISDYTSGKKMKLTPQDNSKATLCKRRKPSESIINVKDLNKYSAKDIYNMVRCLQPPYPVLELKFDDDSLLVLNSVSLR